MTARYQNMDYWSGKRGVYLVPGLGTIHEVWLSIVEVCGESVSGPAVFSQGTLKIKGSKRSQRHV